MLFLPPPLVAADCTHNTFLLLQTSPGGGTWSSNNTAVATVAANGVITGKAIGTAVISYNVTQNDCSGSTTRSITVASAETGISISNCSTTNITFTSGFVSSQTWVVGSQTWSAPVTATYCRKTTYSSESSGTYGTDCRANNGTSTAVNTTYGDLFSWCMVAKFATSICPSGWRVPTNIDFCNLDKALNSRSDCTSRNDVSSLNRYLSSSWGGQSGVGLCSSDGQLGDQGRATFYWSQTENNAGLSYHLTLYSGSVIPQDYHNKYLGASLRCVK